MLACYKYQQSHTLIRSSFDLHTSKILLHYKDSGYIYNSYSLEY